MQRIGTNYEKTQNTTFFFKTLAFCSRERYKIFFKKRTHRFFSLRDYRDFQVRDLATSGGL